MNRVTNMAAGFFAPIGMTCARSAVTTVVASTYEEARSNALAGGPVFMNGPAALCCPRCDGWMQTSEFKETLSNYVRCFRRIDESPSRREWNRLWGAVERDRSLMYHMWPVIESGMDAHQHWERFFMAGFARELERGLRDDLKYDVAEALVRHVVESGRHDLVRWLLDYGRAAIQEGVKPSLHSAITLSLERAGLAPEKIKPLPEPAKGLNSSFEGGQRLAHR
jgi:hypothetical protein